MAASCQALGAQREKLSGLRGGGSRSVPEHRTGAPWLGLENAALGRLSGRVNFGAKTQLIWELSRGWASWAEETASRRRGAQLKAAVNRAVSPRPRMPSQPASLDSIWAAERQGGFGAGGLRSGSQSPATAPFVGKVQMVAVPPGKLTGSARLLSLLGVPPWQARSWSLSTRRVQ